MIDRNQVKIIMYVLRNAPRRILTYLESRILKISPLVQKFVTFEPVHSGAIPSKSAGIGKKWIKIFFGFLAKISSI